MLYYVLLKNFFTPLLPQGSAFRGMLNAEKNCEKMLSPPARLDLLGAPPAIW